MLPLCGGWDVGAAWFAVSLPQPQPSSALSLFWAQERKKKTSVTRRVRLLPACTELLRGDAREVKSSRKAGGFSGNQVICAVASLMESSTGQISPLLAGDAIRT